MDEEVCTEGRTIEELKLKLEEVEVASLNFPSGCDSPFAVEEESWGRTNTLLQKLADEDVAFRGWSPCALSMSMLAESLEAALEKEGLDIAFSTPESTPESTTVRALRRGEVRRGGDGIRANSAGNEEGISLKGILDFFVERRDSIDLDAEDRVTRI